MDRKTIIAIAIAVVILIAIFGTKWCCACSKENYRDPIYLNRAKYVYDYYPRANGSIYGYPSRYGGSWNLFSGYPYYDRAY